MTIPLRCLQVEDSESDAALIVRLLKKARFQVQGERVECATGLRAALSRQPWDVIIADFCLPGFDAYKALSVLKESGLDIPFIGVSGKAGNEIAAEMMKRGAADYLTKNSLERLVPAVKRELREAEIRRNRKIIEAALTEEKERLWTTLCCVGESVIVTDVHGAITLLNPAAEKLICQPTDELAGLALTEVFQLLDPHTRKPCPDPVTLALKTGDRQESPSANLFVDRNGAERIILHSALPVKNSRCEVIGAVLVIRDVSEEEKINEALLNSNKLKSIGIVASEIAHDFSNFLSSIFGNIELAHEYCMRHSLSKVMERLRLTLKIFNSAKNLTQQLLVLAQGGKPVLKTMPLGPILCQSARLVLRGSGITCEMSLPEDLWQCSVDENQMSLVVDNIILNARQVMPEGGSMNITATNISAGSTAIPQQIYGDVVRVAISDTGPGIEAEQFAGNFEPFFTDKQCSKKGFGLSSVYAIMKQHGGLVTVESQIGKGTTFLLYIPRAGQAAPAEAEPQLSNL